MKSETMKLYDDRNDVTLTSYILEDSPELLDGKSRPGIIICPGGAYLNCSDREAEPVALRFAAMGYHAFVLRYSVYYEGKGGMPDMSETLQRKTHCIHPSPMREIGKAMLMVTSRAKEWLLDTRRIVICGFSAGAHNCAMYAVNWDKPVITDYFGEGKEHFRPAAVILGYPLTDYYYMRDVVRDNPTAAGFFAASNTAFLGMAEVTDELFEEVSPVYHVTENTPPMFIWSTASDDLLPIQHSIRMAHALADCNIPFALHIFEEGAHGLSLANQTTSKVASQINEDVAQWINLAEKWLQKRFADKPLYDYV
ncbi:alpha/beta hydrolase [Kineothrix sp. MB12-C1]|uniref:alpha/beta hydrolase n=1 Tax=Kineothrix sp. MB12-C1 TaxID=3070215 RepID=UPI0027D23220|nr:alpha/beta hydrolase [Kineothrix sp. MB12-C1]WMC93319.1 alpha/beta hydrolase [Kineothrix sp. MB12-C1]